MPADRNRPAPPRSRQRAKLSVRVGRRARVVASVSVTGGGLLAVGALVSSVLLSTAVLVRTATNGAAATRERTPELEPDPTVPRLASR